MDGMLGNTVDDLAQVGFGIDAVEFGRADQAVDGRRPLTGRLQRSSIPGRASRTPLPRRATKSTLVSQLFVLWCLLTGRKKYSVIVMDSID
jgi:hypothetical protein